MAHIHSAARWREQSLVLRQRILTLERRKFRVPFLRVDATIRLLELAL